MSNARKHVTPDGSDVSVSRATIFALFGQSINDVTPVANVTERDQVVADLVAVGSGPSSTRPLIVIRGDAPGLHRVEYTYDGTAWIPVSGALRFASKSAADSFGTSYAGYLTAGDEGWAAGVRIVWSGTAWVWASQAVAHEPAGAAIAGVSIASSTLALPSGVQMKTGRHTFVTSVAFGNEYAPALTFGSAFPNGLLSLVVTQIQNDGALAYANVAYDQASASGFRVMYPGGSANTKRAFTWIAIGY